MPKAKTTEFRQMETADLFDQLEKRREALFRLRLSWAAGSLENPKEIEVVRHDIARILTLLRERELALEIARQEADAPPVVVAKPQPDAPSAQTTAEGAN
jgi:large subunit ribosomal protein L29